MAYHFFTYHMTWPPLLRPQRTDDDIGGPQAFAQGRSVDGRRIQLMPNVLDSTELIDMVVEYLNLAPQAGRGPSSIFGDRAGTNDHDFGGRYARDATEDDPLSPFAMCLDIRRRST